MKAWLLDSLDGLKALRIGEVPNPKARPGEVVLKLDYAALNPADRYLTQREYPANPTFPHILGRDGIGTIIEVSDQSADWKIGDRAILLRSEIGVNQPGTFAEQVAAPVVSLAKAPAGWSDAEAAGAPLVYLSAYQALSQWGDIPPSIVLVTGASGGVGVAAVQLAVASGHRVVALSRNPQKRETLKQLGATYVFDPADADWSKQLKTQLGKERVDLAIDSIGGTLFNQVLGLMGMNGKISAIGRLAGPVPEFNTASLFFRRIKIGGVAIGSYTAEESQAAWQSVVATLGRAGVKPLVDSIHLFEDLLQAFSRLEEGPMGKVLIKMR